MRRRPTRRQRAWLGRWGWPLAGAAVALFLALVAFNWWQQSQVASASVHDDIAAGRSGAEVTFTGTVLSTPVNAGDHEQIQVSDGAGDNLELDYNTTLGEWIPAKPGDRLTIHGRLYIDAGPRYGVHCLHAKTSSGCPLPGYIQLNGTTYD